MTHVTSSITLRPRGQSSRLRISQSYGKKCITTDRWTVGITIFKCGVSFAAINILV